MCEKISNFGEKYISIQASDILALLYMKNIRIICAACLTVMVAAVSQSCGSNTGDATLHRLDQQLSQGDVPEDSLMFRAAERLFEMCGYGPLYQLSAGDYASKPSILEHREAVEREFADMSHESRAIGKAFDRLRAELPGAVIPRLFTIISPYTQSIFVDDTTMYIGLNHYLGTSYEKYEYFPEYVRRLKVRPRLPIDVVEAIVRTSYPYEGGEYPQTVSRLAYEGAVAEAVMRITGKDEAMVMGYADKDYLWLRDHEHEMWDTLVSRRLLFSSDNAVIRSLVGVNPASMILSSDAPGWAGRYIGHRLVESYLSGHSGTSIETLLSPDFYRSPSLLSDAGYNP